MENFVDYSLVRAREAVCRAEVSSAAAEVNQAALQWADDLRWFVVDRGDDRPCLFQLTRTSWFVVNPTVEVVASPIGDSTYVEFRAYLKKHTDPRGFRADLEQVVERFANGVRRELVARGATVEPARLKWPQQDRGRLRTLSRLVGPAYWFCLAAFAPAGVIAGLMAWSFWLGFAVAMWLAVCSLLAALVRYRTVGMKAWPVRIGFLVPAFIAALALTVIAAVG